MPTCLLTSYSPPRPHVVMSRWMVSDIIIWHDGSSTMMRPPTPGESRRARWSFCGTWQSGAGLGQRTSSCRLTDGEPNVVCDRLWSWDCGKIAIRLQGAIFRSNVEFFQGYLLNFPDCCPLCEVDSFLQMSCMLKVARRLRQQNTLVFGFGMCNVALACKTHNNVCALRT